MKAYQNLAFWCVRYCGSCRMLIRRSVTWKRPPPPRHMERRTGERGKGGGEENEVLLLQEPSSSFPPPSNGGGASSYKDRPQPNAERNRTALAVAEALKS